MFCLKTLMGILVILKERGTSLCCTVCGPTGVKMLTSFSASSGNDLMASLPFKQTPLANKYSIWWSNFSIIWEAERLVPVSSFSVENSDSSFPQKSVQSWASGWAGSWVRTETGGKDTRMILEVDWGQQNQGR